MRKYIITGLCILTMFMTGCGAKSLKTGTYTISTDEDMPQVYILDDENFSISYVNDPDEAEYTGIYEIEDNVLLLYDIEDYNSADGTKNEPTFKFEIDGDKIIYVDITQNRLSGAASGSEFVLSKK